uniref:Uncharacterized protein n=1 Tax=Nannochloropsis gaditana (strain CCMP526) TaxID=1093141 RepID=I2CRI7_NANGC
MKAPFWRLTWRGARSVCLWKICLTRVSKSFSLMPSRAKEKGALRDGQLCI